SSLSVLLRCDVLVPPPHRSIFFFFTYPAPTDLSPLSLHDALPISAGTTWNTSCSTPVSSTTTATSMCSSSTPRPRPRTSSTNTRSEEHTSELQSLTNLVCRLLLEKKKTTSTTKPLYTPPLISPS